MSNKLHLLRSPLGDRERAAAGGGEPAVTVRLALPGDRAAVARLAALDSSPPPAGRLLVAEVEGELWAALPLAGGPAVADPFRPTTDVVALLELRAAHLRNGHPGHRRRPVRLPLHA